MHELLLEIFGGLRPMTDEVLLNAVWLEDGDKTFRFCSGDKFRLVGGLVRKCNGLPPTHLLMHSYGLLSGIPTRIEAMNLVTNKMEIIKL